MLDLDRGVTKRRHPNGFVVAMYKDAPGHFVDVNGSEIGAQLARQAGFDVDRLEIERTKREKIEAARTEIEQEFASRSEEIERVLDAKTESYAVRHVGGGKYGIFDDAGTRLTTRPMTQKEANDFVEKLDLRTSDEPEDPPPEE